MQQFLLQGPINEQTKMLKLLKCLNQEVKKTEKQQEKKRKERKTSLDTFFLLLILLFFSSLPLQKKRKLLSILLLFLLLFSSSLAHLLPLLLQLASPAVMRLRATVHDQLPYKDVKGSWQVQ